MDPNLRAILLVHGYVRHMENKAAVINSDNHNVLDIYKLVQSFHLVSDIWNNELSHNKFEIDGKYLRLMQHAGAYNTFCNAFGVTKIKRGEKKLWKIKIHELDDCFWTSTVSLAIGVIDFANIKNNMEGNFYDENHGGYAFVAGNGWLNHKSLNNCIKRYGVRCKKNDIIEMELDMTSSNCTLKYDINDKDCGIAFEQIAYEKKEYVIAVSMWKTDQIELLQ
eukprot:432664_1